MRFCCVSIFAIPLLLISEPVGSSSWGELKGCTEELSDIGFYKYLSDENLPRPLVAPAFMRAKMIIFDIMLKMLPKSCLSACYEKEMTLSVVEFIYPKCYDVLAQFRSYRVLLYAIQVFEKINKQVSTWYGSGEWQLMKKGLQIMILRSWKHAVV